MGRIQNFSVNQEDRGPADHKLTRPDAFRIVLFEPRIPQNTGAIARLCAATGSRLDLINPFFEINDAKLKRAGLDYWPLLDVCLYKNLEDWFQKNPNLSFWLVEVGAKKRYSHAKIEKGAALFFGDEQEGLPKTLLEEFSQRHVCLPQQGVRSMNLAMVVGIVTFEALRQNDFLGLLP